MARGFGINVNLDPDIIRTVAQEVESRGYTSFWTNNSPGTDGLQALRIAGEVTSNVKLGVGVIPVQTHPKEQIIERSGKGTSDELPMGRLLLGIGAKAPGALDAIRENVPALREALGCEVYIAALGPKMCHLAGEVADGVVFNWLTPEWASHLASIVEEGAQSAGRPTPRTMTYVRVCLGDDGLEKLKAEAARYNKSKAYNAHFKRMGVDGVGASIPANDKAEIHEALKAWDGVLDEIIVRSITANETLEETMALVEAGTP